LVGRRVVAPRLQVEATAKRMFLVPTVILLVAMLAACFVIPEQAAAENFYAGKTVTILVGFSAGGGFDVNARALARHIGRHIPGTPNVVVDNMPGASSVTSILYLDNKAPQDGTFIDTFNFGLLSASLLRPNLATLDLRKYAWLGSVSEDLTACYVRANLGPKTIAELKAHGPIHFGNDGVGTSEDINERILSSVVGLAVRQVGGYAGSAQVRLAIERGELDGDCGAWSSLPEDWIKQKKISPISRSGMAVPEGLTPDVPYIADLAPDDRARQIINLLVSGGQLGRPFIASATVPPERLKILRDAFDATMKDPEFRADLDTLRLPFSPKTADEALKTVGAIYASPPDIIEAAKKIVTQ
jgi:tripartite-type tricarboxylate transporter receptor subunit TctC